MLEKSVAVGYVVALLQEIIAGVQWIGGYGFVFHGTDTHILLIKYK